MLAAFGLQGWRDRLECFPPGEGSGKMLTSSSFVEGNPRSKRAFPIQSQFWDYVRSLHWPLCLWKCHAWFPQSVSRRLRKDFTVPSGVCYLSCFELPSEAGCGLVWYERKLKDLPRFFRIAHSLDRHLAGFFRVVGVEIIAWCPTPHDILLKLQVRWGLGIKWSN